MSTHLRIALVLAGLAAFGTVGAQEFPTKPIRLVVPFSPGGGTDLQARTIGQGLHEAWGQPVVVDHRPGGTGAVGSAAVLNSPADGYTLIIVTSSTHAIAPNLHRKPPYDPVKDFAAVAQTATAPEVVVAHPSLPVKSIKDLISFAKANPGKLNFASPGAGTIGHMTGELFKIVTGVNIVHVAYKGSGSATRELLGGQVELMFSAPGAVISHVRAGRLKALAAATAKRSPNLKDIPTLAEAGYPEIEASNWYGILSRAGTPGGVIQKLNQAIVKIMGAPKIEEMLANQGYDVETTTPAQFSDHLKKEYAKWQKVVAKSGMQLQ
jgi:tripartite-type tricarboxylate transporter receptor subunit TctC